MKKDLDRDAYIEQDLRRHHAVRFSFPLKSAGRIHRCPRGLEHLPQGRCGVGPRFQVQAGREPWNYSVCYPARQLRPPVHQLGPQLFSNTYFFLRLAAVPFNEAGFSKMISTG